MLKIQVERQLASCTFKPKTLNRRGSGGNNKLNVNEKANHQVTSFAANDVARNTTTVTTTRRLIRHQVK